MISISKCAFNLQSKISYLCITFDLILVLDSEMRQSLTTKGLKYGVNISLLIYLVINEEVSSLNLRSILSTI